MSYAEHARRELRLAGEFDRDPEYAATLAAAVAVLDVIIEGETLTTAIAREQLALLLRHGTLSALTDDPAEWDDRSETTGRRLWQNSRNPFAYSDDGGHTFWLLAERQSYSPDPPPLYPTAPHPGSGAGAQVIELRRDTRGGGGS